MIVNPRRYATQKRIQQALISLIRQNGFKAVTVGAILQKARVSRGTFYRYYLDKFDLLAQTEARFIVGARDIFAHYDKPDLMGLTSSATHEHDAFYALLVYLYQQQLSVATLMTCPDSALIPKMHDLIEATIAIPSTPQTTAHSGTTELPTNLVKELVVSNIMTILSYWLAQPIVAVPKIAYQIFLESRQLSPLTLTQLLTTAASMAHD